MHGSEQDALSGLEVSDIRADFDDFAGYVAAEDVGQIDAGQSFADPHVEVVQGAGADADEDLVFARLGIGDIFVGENFRTTELMETDGFHGGSSDLNPTR
jgi:hypothetical protein